jgi:hypothetical protein
MTSTDDNARELKKREEKAFGAKTGLDSLHQELALNFHPVRADFQGERTLGEEFALDIFDSEPLRCSRDLADARSAMLRPDGQEWNRVQTQDEELNEQPHIARSLDAINKRWLNFLGDFRNGFQKATKEGDGDHVNFGYHIISPESEIDRYGDRVPVMRCWHPRDCAFYMDITGIKPDVMFRKLRMAARHIKKKFPKAELADGIKEALENNPDQEFNLCHVMMPSDEYDYYKRPKGRRSRDAQWASIYYDSDHQTLLREGASERFRYVVDRWMTIPGSQYGYSPAAMTALADARGMQIMARVLLEAGEKSLDGPLKAVDGAVKSDIDLSAGGITWVDKDYDERLGPAIEPLLPNNRNVPIGFDLVMRATAGMRESWYISKLRLPMQSKTAYETQALLEQFIREALPLFSPWQNGLHMGLEEVFWVAIDLGIFKGIPIPEELLEAERVFSFSNPLRDAIERNRVNQANQILPILAGMAQFDPNIVKSLDYMKMISDVSSGVGAPADWLADPAVAQEAVAVEQQTQGFLQALGTAGQVAEIAKTGSEAAATLTDIDRGEAGDGSFVYGPA